MTRSGGAGVAMSMSPDRQAQKRVANRAADKARLDAARGECGEHGPGRGLGHPRLRRDPPGSGLGHRLLFGTI